MSRERDRESTEASAWWRVLAEHPVITGFVAACTVGGAILGVLLLTDDWSIARRLLGGAVGGAGVGLLVTATRMIG